VPRWLRSVNAQLILWAVLPITFVIIALSFSGVYSHQRTMRQFVTERNLSLASVTARALEDGLGHGVVKPDGSGLQPWLSQLVGAHPGKVVVADRTAGELAAAGPDLPGTVLAWDPVSVDSVVPGEGSVIVPSSDGDLLMTFVSVSGTEWVVAVLEPVEELTGPLLRFPSLVPLVAISAGLLSLLVLAFGWITIVSPLRKLGRAAEQVVWDDYTAISRPVRGVQEIRDLHQTLAEMVERVRNYQAAVRDYAGAMTRGQEAERGRLALELHDGPVQDLIALNQRAEMALRMVQRGDTEGASAKLQEMRSADESSVEELRRLIGALRPTYLEDLGLLPALEMLVLEANGRAEADVLFAAEPSAPRLTPEVELVAYRIAQEALNNALQHSRANEIVVRLSSSPSGVELVVSDDGLGFAVPRDPNSFTQESHFGLLGMRERANLAGGTIEIESIPGSGTKIVVHLPQNRAPDVDSSGSLPRPSAGGP
jgi:signal transduction histidine kinase